MLHYYGSHGLRRLCKQPKQICLPMLLHSIPRAHVGFTHILLQTQPEVGPHFKSPICADAEMMLKLPVNGSSKSKQSVAVEEKTPTSSAKRDLS
eukprot:scaffold25997_cov68-Cyclotella_meneghiniana.AAC.6